MKVSTLLLMIAASQLTSGCGGHLYTVLNPDDLVVDDGKEKIIEGVIVYQAMDVVEVYQTMALVDKKTKNIIGAAPKECVPKRSMKFATRANYSKPYILKYDAGLLESNTFGLTLKDGVVAAVNTSSDPSKSATSTAALLPFFATPAAPASVTKDIPFCNDQTKLVGVFEAPSIRKFNEIPTE